MFLSHLPAICDWQRLAAPAHRPRSPDSRLLRRQHHRRVRPSGRPGLSRLPAKKARRRRATRTKSSTRAPAAPPPRTRSPALPVVLRLHPAIVIVEFGGNDGLRGLPVDQSRSNLDQVLTALRECACQDSARRHHAPAGLRPRLHSLVRSDLSRSGREAPRRPCAHALQGSGQCSGNDPGRRHPSHRKRLGDHRRHAVSGAQAAAAQKRP